MSEPASISISVTATGTAPLHGITVANCGKNCSLPIKKNIKSLPFIEEKYLDQPHIRVAIHKNSKKPVLENWVNHPENRTIGKLLKIGNYGLRTGTKLGEYYFCALDIDKKGEQFHFSQISYIKTSKGIHYYLLLKKLPENSPLFYQGEKIGRVMSFGKQIIGSGSIHSSGIIYQFMERGEVFLKFKGEKELANYWNGYGIVLEKKNGSIN
ncbi:hypothetical protein C1646_820488 [Rhizophagus diaphanus]|nr:hypothetical protein C1646_820488 [Rhizophagus diaphanus] [Rhizophagus sp. MUCL 43196]